VLDRSTLGRNTFQETLLGLEYTTRPDHPADLFSQACVEQYRELDLTRFGYLFAQVFEPDVLKEVALLEGVPYASLADLSHRPTTATTRLAELVRDAADLSAVALVNVAAALISISRFDLAIRVLDQAGERTRDVRERFEVAMLEFVVANRSADGVGSLLAFQRMRAAIESGTLPPERALDACTQAVVWYLKRREPPEEDFRWYLATGTALADAGDRLDPAAISSWYRGLAMVPAAEGDAEVTRRYMGYARDTADTAFARRPRAYEMHFMKTYHESSLKEHMYVTKNLDRAEESGRALIALDPAWSPSYGELAEAYVKFGRLAQAAHWYDKAVEMGPPYLGYHLFHAARAHEKAGNDEQALGHYRTLSELAPSSEPVLVAGMAVAARLSHHSLDHFESAIARLGRGTGR
jgi:tetratricopeptide (TPR) repeat protein